MRILAIETSFDETAAAIVDDGTKVVTNVIATSKEMHEKYGGVVPEIAARQQLQSMIPVLTEALLSSKNNTVLLNSNKVFASIDAIAVTIGPGLIGSLLVGVETAKTLAFVTKKPLIPVNHVLAHMYANFIDSSFVIPGVTRNPSSSNAGSPAWAGDDKKEIQFPAISLVVSGAHTELYFMKNIKDLQWLGGTLDGASGECFDKTARLLGFGYGGGVAIEKAAARGNIKLPRPMMDESFDFSFSGLKTAVMREWKKHLALAGSNPANAFAYEIQEAITDVLVEKTIRAAKKFNAKSILLSGGVAANTRLREKFPVAIHVPPPALCTDNAVMIAAVAYFRGNPVDWHEITAIPDLSVKY